MATGTRPSQIPESVLEDILASERRRIALELLAARDESVVIDDLAAAVRARERDTTPDAVSRSERVAVRNEFFATHLPKMTATGLVDYDSRVGTVELTGDERLTDRLSSR